MEHIDILLSKILHTAPYQLPPVIHSDGCYTVDVVYLGKPFTHIGISLQECLDRYYEFVTKTNYINPKKIHPLTDAPVRPGTSLPHTIH